VVPATRRSGFDFAGQVIARAIMIDAHPARVYAVVADCCSFLSVCWNGSEDNLNEAEAASHKVY